MRRLYGVWCHDIKDWLRDMNGGLAILAFESKKKAQDRATEHFGFSSYAILKGAGWAEVKKLTGN